MPFSSRAPSLYVTLSSDLSVRVSEILHHHLFKHLSALDLELTLHELTTFLMME